jgi:hypothetical protein
MAGAMGWTSLKHAVLMARAGLFEVPLKGG